MKIQSLTLACAMATLFLSGQPSVGQTPVAPGALASGVAPNSTTGPASPTGPVAGLAASVTRQLTVNALEDMDLVAAAGGDAIGDIEGVVENNADKKRFVLIERGGFMGFGAKEKAVPLENLVVQNDKLALRNMDVAQLDALPEFDNGNNTFRELDAGQQVNVPVQQ